jgi:hypothetical protein
MEDLGLHKCTICIEYILTDIEFLPCAHAFHQECVREWLRDHPVCPICKIPVHIKSLEDLEVHNMRQIEEERIREEDSIFYHEVSAGRYDTREVIYEHDSDSEYTDEEKKSRDIDVVSSGVDTEEDGNIDTYDYQLADLRMIVESYAVDEAEGRMVTEEEAERRMIITAEVEGRMVMAQELEDEAERRMIITAEVEGRALVEEERRAAGIAALRHQLIYGDDLKQPDLDETPILLGDDSTYQLPISEPISARNNRDLLRTLMSLTSVNPDRGEWVTINPDGGGHNANLIENMVQIFDCLHIPITEGEIIGVLPDIP